jgi:hypothetical protein
MEEGITAKELGLHQRAIERIRAKLFDRYRPEDYPIVMSTLEVIPPLMTERWDPAGLVRRLKLGGFKFESFVPQAERVTAILEHQTEDQFGLWITQHNDGRYAGTGCTLTKFRTLDQHLKECIEFLRGERVSVPTNLWGRR